MACGRIVKGIGGIYTIFDIETKTYIKASLRGKLRFMVVDKDSSFNKKVSHKTKIETKTIKLLPKVGDLVLYSKEDDVYVIDSIQERNNDLERPSIANIDQVLLIFAATRPVLQYILLDQFLALMSKANVDPVIVITKIDLLNEEEMQELKLKMSYYQKIGYKVFFVNSKEKVGFEAILPIFKDKITVLSGQTGAGKSTFVNALIPGFSLQTQDISIALGRGKHTTTATELYEFMGGFIGDTPGFSKLDFNLFTKEELKDYFIEFNGIECKYRGCLHDKETGCKVKEMLSNNEIASWRYENYLKFLEQIKNTVKKY